MGTEDITRRRAAWFADTLVRLGDTGTKPDTGEVADNFAGDNLEETAAEFIGMTDWLGRTRAESITTVDERVAVISFASEAGRAWTVTLAMSDEASPRIAGINVERTLPAGTVIRYGTPADGPGLAEIARVPLQLGEATLVIDPGEDFFTQVRVQHDATVVVAEVAGKLAGMYSAALHEARVNDETVRVLTLRGSRNLPEFQRAGLFTPMQRMLVGTYKNPDRYDFLQTFIHPDNAPAKRLTVVDPWSVRPLRALLPCAVLAGPPAGRTATREDASVIAAALDALHGDEEMYLPLTTEQLAQRLAQASDLYSWQNIVVDDGCAVGMWIAGERRVWTEDGLVDETRRAWAVDYGCVPGAEDKLEALLRDRCRVAAEAGMTHLAVFTSEPSRSFAIVEPLSERLEPYEFRTAFHDEPANATRNGLYVDPLYF